MPTNFYSSTRPKWDRRYPRVIRTSCHSIHSDWEAAFPMKKNGFVLTATEPLFNNDWFPIVRNRWTNHISRISNRLFPENGRRRKCFSEERKRALLLRHFYLRRAVPSGAPAGWRSRPEAVPPRGQNLPGLHSRGPALPHPENG